MDSRQRVLDTIAHHVPDVIPIDFGSTSVTGMHCRMVAGLRKHYGLEDRPVRVIEPYQMLGEIDEELQQIIGVDCVPLNGRWNWYNIDNTRMHEQMTPWGQPVLIAEDIDLTTDEKGDVYVYAAGDRSYPPSGKMPSKAFFFDAIERNTEVDDDALDPAENLEEYGPVSDEDLAILADNAVKARATGKAVVASFGGTGLGDIAYIPGMALRDPKGIRGIEEWYMSTVIRQDYIDEMFERQVDIALANFEKYWAAVGENVDIAFICGTDFGTQDSQFCSVDTFEKLWLPHYRRINDWVHEHTTWKTFKHSCGSIVPLIPGLIEAGFDIINPVQINAAGMKPQWLKDTYGDRVTFWGGGVDTQKVLPFGTPEQVRQHVIDQCRIMGAGGGFVFDTVHNVQANVPLANMVAVIETMRELRSGGAS